MGGCFSHSKADLRDGEGPPTLVGDRIEKRTKQYAKPTWTAPQPLTAERLQTMRAEFWDTQPHYGGNKVIWDALKAACEVPDIETARLIIDSAGIIVVQADMTICYDERGAKYELPLYVLSDPTNVSA